MMLDVFIMIIRARFPEPTAAYLFITRPPVYYLHSAEKSLHTRSPAAEGEPEFDLDAGFG